MTGPDNPEYKWGGEGQSDPTRAIPTTPGQGFQPQPWPQNPPGQGAPPPPQPGAWGQPPAPPPTHAWGQPPQGPPPGQPSWGQPPQPSQQWAPQPNQPWQQTGQPGQPEYGQFQPSPQGKSKLPLILGLVAAGVLLLALIVAALVFGPKLFGSQVLDQGAVESGVETVLTDSYGLQGVSGASCPADQKVESGTTFTCSVTVDGESRTVTVRVIDDEGTYEVSKPQ